MSLEGVVLCVEKRQKKEPRIVRGITFGALCPNRERARAQASLALRVSRPVTFVPGSVVP